MLARLLGIRIFDVEAAGACNLACPFCPRELLPPAGIMSPETFSLFLEHTPLGATDSLAFVGIGEPMLNRHLPDFIRLARERYPRLMNTWLTTNGTLLNEKRLPPLLDAGLDTLDVSFNGLTPGEYEPLMKGASFEKVLRNLHYTVGEIRKRHAPTELQINFILTQENAREEERIKDFWRARGIARFRVNHLHDRAGTMSAMEGMTVLDAPGLRGSACELFEVIQFITWEGDVTYCCHDIPRKHKLGNIRSDTWSEIERRKRAVVRGGCWPELCGRCTDPLRHDMRAKVDERMRSEVKERVLGVLGSLVGGKGSEK